MRHVADKKRGSSSANRKSAAANPAVEGGTVDEALRAAMGCKACDLYRHATQTVFGEGPVGAKIMFVGEQPGDQEDREGRPFVGPAGRILDEALAEVGIDRADVYLTNVVKHFKWVAAQRGKRRIHKKPRYSEIHAYRPWLDAEIALVKPQVFVCLGATAAQSLLGRTFSVKRQHGQVIPSPLAPVVMATLHPSAILRAPDSEGPPLADESAFPYLSAQNYSEDLIVAQGIACVITLHLFGVLPLRHIRDSATGNRPLVWSGRRRGPPKSLPGRGVRAPTSYVRRHSMNKALRTDPGNSRSDWQQLFEAALLESDPVVVYEKFQNAKDAIMDRIEDCFDKTSLSERGMLLSALNTISELEQPSRPDEVRRRSSSRIVGHAA